MKKGESKRLNEALLKDSACYVLITCGNPSREGLMNVEMTYEGDPALAAYLLKSAQQFVEETEEESIAGVGLEGQSGCGRSFGVGGV